LPEKKSHLLRFVFIGWVTLLLCVGVFPVSAQGQLDIEINEVDLDFPNTLNFTLKASSGEAVSEVYLEYGSNARSCVQGIARQEAELTEGDPFLASWEWDFKDSGSLPPGAEIWWQWVVNTASGQVIRTERQSLTIEDPNLAWQRIENDQVLLVWSEGSQTFARRILDVATSSLEDLAQEAGIQPEGQVRLTVYPSFESLRDAGLFLPEWTGGVAYPEYGVSIIGIPVDSGDWVEEVVPHELAHLVTGERVFNCLGVGIPTWLSEGISVYSETPFSEVDSERVLAALESDTLPPLHSLAGGFPADAAATTLAYAQSGEVVRYLIKEYGPQSMGSLLAAVQSGMRINPALQEVYGFDTDGLDNLWRSSSGFEVVTADQTATPTLERTAVPTLALWTPEVRASATATPPPTATPTPVEAAAAASSTATPDEPTSTAEPLEQGETTGLDAEEDSQAENTPPSGLSCLRGSTLLGGLFLALATVRVKRSRRLK
jgi:hypothetical protein